MNFKSHTLSGLQYLKDIKAVSQGNYDTSYKFIKNTPITSPTIWPQLTLNLAIAIEHIVLKALDFNLGTCWIGGFYPDKIKELFNFGDNLTVVAILPIGYPAETPKPKKRLPLENILLISRLYQQIKIMIVFWVVVSFPQSVSLSLFSL